MSKKSWSRKAKVRNNRSNYRSKNIACNNGKIPEFPIPTECPYCNNEVVFTLNSELYGKIQGDGFIYFCRNCCASVGVHPGTNIPLGMMADKELLRLRTKAHKMFDKYWESGQYTRGEAYGLLSQRMKIKKEECHFGWFDKEKLERAITILEHGLIEKDERKPLANS